MVCRSVAGKLDPASSQCLPVSPVVFVFGESELDAEHRAGRGESEATARQCAETSSEDPIGRRRAAVQRRLIRGRNRARHATMDQYTFVASRDPVGGDRVVHDLAIDLAGAGNGVSVFLVENGALLARRTACEDLRGALRHAGVQILADELALAERGIAGATLADGVEVASLEVLVDHMAEGRKVVWH
jgi:predicted peroxiredoxin